MTEVLPGATIGLLGGGQLGRMTALAARSLGYDVIVLDPDPACSAAAVASRLIVADFNNAIAAAELGRACDVVTFEIERMSLSAVRAAAAHAPVRPSVDVLEIIQDRARQKAWLRAAGFPVGPYVAAPDAAAAAEAVNRAGHACHVKRTRDGYDGRGQMHVHGPVSAETLRTALGDGPLVVEHHVPLMAELSVLVARSPSNEQLAYPAARNWHADGILTHSVLPADLDPGLCRQAQDIASDMVERLALEGLLVVEFFWTGQDLFVNELAPRPHNTYHASELACATSQFEQLVRAICDLPLGEVEARFPTALVNLLGDDWLHGLPQFRRALSIPGTHLRLYGKAPRPRRKVGHLLATGPSSAQAVAQALAAGAAFRSSPVE